MENKKMEYPRPILLGFCYDEFNREFVRVFYGGLYNLTLETCAPEEVRSELFVDSKIIDLLDNCGKAELFSFFDEKHYDFIDRRAICNYDLRLLAYLLSDMQGNNPGTGYYVFMCMRECIGILAETLGSTSEAVLEEFFRN